MFKDEMGKKSHFSSMKSSIEFTLKGMYSRMTSEEIKKIKEMDNFQEQVIPR